MTNPLLQTWDTPFALPPYDLIKDTDYAPAFETTLAQARREIAEIAENPAAPDFTNTILALEAAGQNLERVLSTFYTVLGADSNPARQTLQREFGQALAGYVSDIYSNSSLWSRVQTVWEHRDEIQLDAQEARLLLLTHREFIRAGAALNDEKSARMRAIRLRLAELGTAFTQNLLADEANWSMDLSDADLDGVPEFVADAARMAAQEADVGGARLTLARSLVVPFLQFSPRRDLRETAYRAWSARGANGNDYDNRAIASETLALRHERAQLLGYEDFADFKLATEMAGTPEAVKSLLNQIWEPARKAALEDQDILTEMMAADGINGPLEPWDWRYYAAKRRMKEHALDEAEIKPYFQLDQMIAAAFSCAKRLFGLEFAPLDTPLYHPDCRAWEVTRNGEHVAVFIGDYFARPSKRSGAWCSSLRKQAKYPDTRHPIVINVCNFAKSDPALLSHDDARTLFHEFGHALHNMLSDVRFASMSGTSVARDFVELPSQLYEHWLDVPEVLAEFAIHAETHEPLPDNLRDNLINAGTFDMGFQTVEYLTSAFVDLDFHCGTPPTDPMARQAEILDELGCPPAISMRHATPHFAHVFAGDGYAAGYYSYIWSEVMDADAFAAFEETGDPFDADMAAKLERHILSTGGTVEASELYKAFRGSLPDVTPLLAGRGLL